MNRIEKWNEITGAEQEQDMMEAFLESRTDSYAILQLRDIDEQRFPNTIRPAACSRQYL